MVSRSTAKVLMAGRRKGEELVGARRVDCGLDEAPETNRRPPAPGNPARPVRPCKPPAPQPPLGGVALRLAAAVQMASGEAVHLLSFLGLKGGAVWRPTPRSAWSGARGLRGSACRNCAFWPLGARQERASLRRLLHPEGSLSLGSLGGICGRFTSGDSKEVSLLTSAATSLFLWLDRGF